MEDIGGDRQRQCIGADDRSDADRVDIGRRKQNRFGAAVGGGRRGCSKIEHTRAVEARAAVDFGRSERGSTECDRRNEAGAAGRAQAGDVHGVDFQSGCGTVVANGIWREFSHVAASAMRDRLPFDP